MTDITPYRLLFLDLREKGGERVQPVHPAIEVVAPGSQGNCELTHAIAVLVAVDSAKAYDAWMERYHPLCPDGFPSVVLLDPYDGALARRVMADDAADCLAVDDSERLILIVARLSRSRDRLMPPASAVNNDLQLRLQVAIDTLPSPIFIKDRDARYIACNKAFEAYIGLSRREIIGATVYDVAPHELAAIYDKADQDLLARGGVQTYESHVRYADGSVHDVIFHKAVFLNAQGEADGISGTILDISERKALEKQLALAATTDFLTGIGNLRTFYDLGGQEFRRFIRSGEPLALILIDVDYFKEINDRLGHAAGDEALRRFVEVVRANLRDQDIFSRAGGDEFRLLLPDTDLAGAGQVAERIRVQVSEINLSNGRAQLPMSISAGITVCLASDESLDDVCARADAALYRAKAGGRNCHVALP